MAVVTVTGKVGSGVKDLGAGIAARLGIDFVDQQLLLEAAQRLRVPVGKIAERDERVESLSQRIAAVMSSFLERSAVFGSDPLTGAVGLEAMFSRNYMDMEGAQQDQTVRDESYLRTMRGVVQELAERGDVVILGRGSPAILRDLPKALHVYCFAPIPIRIQRVARAEAISEEEAANRIAETDRALLPKGLEDGPDRRSVLRFDCELRTPLHRDCRRYGRNGGAYQRRVSPGLISPAATLFVRSRSGCSG